MPTLPLAAWNNFYVILGSAAAGLTGLTFVVIAIASDAQRINPDGLHAFVTPTIVHFGTVLALAAFMCVPHQTALSLSVGLAVAGIVGILYVVRVGWKLAHAVASYTPVGEDWLWNVVLPFAGYALFAAMAALLWIRQEMALCAVAAISLLKLFIGIHNAWDIAVWMVLRKQDATTPHAAPPTEP